MTSYQHSSQRLRWTLTAEELASRRAGANRATVDAIMNCSQASKNVHRLSPLNVEEEGVLRRVWEGKVQHVCNAFHFPNKIQATAVTYLKRFYIENSVMDDVPKQIMLSCIYLACKIEENYLSAEEFARGLNQKDVDYNSVLKNELRVLEALNFDLIVHSPYRPLEGFSMELEDFTRQLAKDGHGECRCEDEEIGPLIQQCSLHARKVLDALMLSDAILLYPPGQIALAALRIGARACASGKLPIDEFLEFVATQGAQRKADMTEASEKLAATLQKIDEIYGRGNTLADDSVVKAIEKRRQSNRNPVFNPESDAYKANVAKKEAEKEEKRRRKQSMKRAASQQQAEVLAGVFKRPPRGVAEEPSSSKKRKSEDQMGVDAAPPQQEINMMETDQAKPQS
eukprot:scaffold1167_cov418-Prasinococcus_capsulatus_cf.AAC.27